MVLKGLPESFKTFVVVITQRDSDQTFTEFKEALRSFEDIECARRATTDDSVMKTVNSMHSNPSNKNYEDFKCHKCGQPGHFARDCYKYKPRNQMWCHTCKSATHNDNACRRKVKPNRSTQNHRINVASVKFEPKSATLVYKNGTTFNIDQHGKLYYMNLYDAESNVDTVNYSHVIYRDGTKYSVTVTMRIF